MDARVDDEEAREDVVEVRHQVRGQDHAEGGRDRHRRVVPVRAGVGDDNIAHLVHKRIPRACASYCSI